MSVTARSIKTSPLLKYPGGKEKELSLILPSLPADARDYYEPFVGGGAVYLALDADRYFINDKSEELMGLYRMACHQDASFFDHLSAMDEAWQLLSSLSQRYEREFLSLYDHGKTPSVYGEDIFFPVQIFLHTMEDSLVDSRLLCDTPARRLLTDPALYTLAERSFRNKLPRMFQLEEQKGELSREDLLENLAGCLKNAFYLLMRSRYNDRHRLGLDEGESIALYYFMREFCYSSMFRYNKNGEFNVPYGGISYNHKTLSRKIAALKEPALLSQLERTVFTEMDFSDFMQEFTPGPQDFVFVDPPYDTEFSSYDGQDFGKADHIRLASYLIRECPAYFMLIIKNTDFICSLYEEGSVCVGGRPLLRYHFDKKYLVSFKDRNDRKAEHLMITNYPVPPVFSDR